MSQLHFGDEAFYVALLVLLWCNKILLSFFGAKVRMHLLNPGYAKNQEKIEERFRTLTHAKADMLSGIKTGMTAEERARSLVNSGSPNIDKRTDPRNFKGFKKGTAYESATSLDDSDSDDETSFGIIPTSKLRKGEMTRVDKFDKSSF